MMNSIGCGGRSMGASSKNHNISGSNIMVDHQLPNVGFDQIDDAPRATVKVRAMKPDWNFDVHCGSSIPELGAGNKVPVVPVNPRLWDEGVMAPAASEAASLRHQVDALEVDLSAHISNEHHLFTINQQLCDRLAMCSDELNGEKIEAQLKTLQNQIQESLQLLHHLSERNEALEKEKGDVQRMLQKHVEEFEIKRSSMQAEKRSLNAENVCVQAHIRNLAEDLHFRRRRRRQWGTCVRQDQPN
ncbi:unnamed protein product [Sphagnum troendelagicum]|uniref:Uncharacterized protein n=1 Tax=Sphagnum troendelagicum TaxID=128251 RepID=A0ABP0TXU2_9BRYO